MGFESEGGDLTAGARPLLHSTAPRVSSAGSFASLARWWSDFRPTTIAVRAPTRRSGNPVEGATLTRSHAVKAELQKERAAKGKLSDLCRELQKHSKAVQEENARALALEHAKRCGAGAPGRERRQAH